MRHAAAKSVKPRSGAARTEQVRHLTQAPYTPAKPAPRARPGRSVPASLLLLVLPILVLGGLAILNLLSQARLSELEGESRRLERLCLEQNLRQGDLMHEHDRLTNQTLLYNYAIQQKMVIPVGLKLVKVGVLPPRKVYWALPDEGLPPGGAKGCFTVSLRRKAGSVDDAADVALRVYATCRGTRVLAAALTLVEALDEHRVPFKCV